ncbi:glycosyltransferase [Sagittula sp. S175]|uniref:glycosyltransferase n=1 Tax=Sagittula sp. S175 TaxID=3415129 RepID=UPI003C7ACFEF
MNQFSAQMDQGFDIERERYFVDISGTLEHSKQNDFLTGIQRVVVTVVAQLAARLAPDQLYLSWCDKSTRSYKCVPYASVAQGAGILTAPALRSYFFQELSAKGPEALLRKYKDRPLKKKWHTMRLDLAAHMGRKRPFRRKGTTLESWQEMRDAEKLVRETPRAGRPFEQVCAPGDHLLQLDLAVQQWQMQILAEIGKMDVVKHLLIYDLIPLHAPQLVSHDTAWSFLAWLDEAVNHVDAFLAISEFSHEKFRTYLDKTERSGRITTLPLAQDRLPLPDKPQDRVEDRVGRQMTELYPLAKRLRKIGREETEIFCRPFVICVGTIEARKNIWRVAMAWKKLVEESEREGRGELPTLVFVGSASHMPQDFQQFMQGTGGCNGYIRIVSGPSDAFLELLYEHCLFSIQVSLAEGWGLPVGESLAYRRTALVGRGSSLPEVGGDLVEYCDPEEIDSIADAARRLLDADHRAALEARISQAKLRSWGDVADDLLRIVQIDKTWIAQRRPEQQLENQDT